MKTNYQPVGLIVLMAFFLLNFSSIPVSGQGDCSHAGLVNGGFEDFGVAAGDLGFFGSSNGWTSQVQGGIEIWGDGFGEVPAYEGVDFDELNSGGPDILTQDLTTVPGKSYNWQIAHRGRDGIDGANMEFGPPGGPFTVAQAMVDGTGSWGVYSGTYVVPAGQTTTRVRFVSIFDGGGCNSCANFLDGFDFELVDSDADCDGIGNACDVCPGGSDAVDNNNDGLPDCHYLPAYNQIIAAWKCGNNKVLIAHRTGNGGCNTLCVAYSAAQAHINHGDYLGPCGGASCNGNGFVIPDVNISPMTSDELEVYPNPAGDEVNIEFEGLGTSTTLAIYDNLGRTLWTKQVEEGQQSIKIDLSDIRFVNGIYYVQATSDRQMFVQRFVISK